MACGVRDKAWDEFVEWCQRRKLKALPAHPWTIAAFLRALEPRVKPRTMATYLKAITAMHVLKSRKRPDRHPMVTRTLRMIEQRAEARKRDAGLFQDDDFADADRPANRKPKPAPKKPSPVPSRVRVLGSQPKLVPRRGLKD